MASFSVGSTFKSIITYPPGSIIAYLGSSDPTGWVICDGSAKSGGSDGRYNNLINMWIGTGTLNGNYTPPNYKGAFLRGTGSGAGYTGPGVTGYQNMSISQHGHTVTGHSHTTITTTNQYWALIVSGGGTTTGNDVSPNEYDTWRPADSGLKLQDSVTDGESEVTNSTSGTTGTEVRPFNYGVNWIIKL